MATSKIVDAVADAVVRAELAVVKTGRKAVQAVNRRVGGKPTVKRKAKRAVKKAVSRTKRAVRKAVSRVTPKRAKRTRRR